GPQERLLRHQAESAPRMATLEQWMRTQFEERRIESNSTLGAAIRYMQKRWPELTLFLRVPGAPLDNNVTNAVNGISGIIPRHGLFRLARMERDFGLVVRH
ncbi:IS66 family transposase, partial [Acidithiobacillus sp.]